MTRNINQRFTPRMINFLPRIPNNAGNKMFQVSCKAFPYYLQSIPAKVLMYFLDYLGPDVFQNYPIIVLVRLFPGQAQSCLESSAFSTNCFFNEFNEVYAFRRSYLHLFLLSNNSNSNFSLLLLSLLGTSMLISMLFTWPCS